MYYKGRKVTLLLNNLYFIRSSMEEFPVWLDEVKAVYITEHPSATIRYIGSTSNKPTVFIYTHHKFLRDVDGLRRTHFQGYNVPETFEMEDYSIMPPMEDFRRTLYWNPNVTTDKDGKATIEFYNNSVASELNISAEGITKDGKFIISGE